MIYEAMQVFLKMIAEQKTLKKTPCIPSESPHFQQIFWGVLHFEIVGARRKTTTPKLTCRSLIFLGAFVLKVLNYWICLFPISILVHDVVSSSCLKTKEVKPTTTSIIGRTKGLSFPHQKLTASMKQIQDNPSS